MFKRFVIMPPFCCGTNLPVFVSHGATEGKGVGMQIKECAIFLLLLFGCATSQRYIGEPPPTYLPQTTMCSIFDNPVSYISKELCTKGSVVYISEGEFTLECLSHRAMRLSVDIKTNNMSSPKVGAIVIVYGMLLEEPKRHLLAKGIEYLESPRKIERSESSPGGRFSPGGSCH